MISLKDEIKRFENMVYNKQLAQFVTVDQNFVGGGIRIESMIHESNFIVEELKKMNAVFLNYCKLNEKVYSKIIQHELNLLQEHGRLNSLTVSLDRKIDDMTKSMKELHQSTVQENEKSVAIIESVTLPLRQELDKKVDKLTFEAQMKRILEEYDEGTLAKDDLMGDDRLSNGSSHGGLGGLTAEGLPLVKKKGKVSYDDFYRLQAEIHNKMKLSDTKLQDTWSEASESKQLILKYIPTINKSSAEVSIHTTEIYKLNHDVQEQNNHFTAVTHKISHDLNHKTNDQYWNMKFQAFYKQQLRPTFNNIDEAAKTAQRQFKRLKQECQNKFKSIDQELCKIKAQIHTINSELRSHAEEIQQNQERIRLNYEQFYNQQNKNQKNFTQTKADFAKKMDNLEKSMKKETQQLQNTIDNLTGSIEDSVLKAVNKKVELQLKTIQSQIRMNKDKQKGLRNDMGVICEQIKNVKDILSKKANFDDIIHQFEKKANREDFRELQEKLQQTSQQFVSKNLNQSINFSRVQKSERLRANSSTKANRTIVPPRSATNRLSNNKTELDNGTKIFMCGLDGPMGDARGILRNNSRRKSIKSSAAVISDFIL